MPVVKKENLQKVVILTGSLGSGKSTASRILASLGCSVVDADELAREAVAPGSPALAEIVAEFGPQVLSSNGALERKKLGAIVFSDLAKRQRLEEITHPKIRTLADEKLSALVDSTTDLVIYDCPLFFEANLDNTGFGPVIVISAPDEVCLRRIVERDQLSPSEASIRFHQQLPLAEKRAKADFVVENSGTIAELETQLKSVFNQLKTR